MCRDAELGLAYGLIQSAGQTGSFAAFYGIPAIIHASGRFVDGFVIGGFVAMLALGALYAGYTLERVAVPMRDNDDASAAVVSMVPVSNEHDAERVPLRIGETGAVQDADADDGWSVHTPGAETRAGLQKRTAPASQQASPKVVPLADSSRLPAEAREDDTDSDGSSHRVRALPPPGTPIICAACVRWLHSSWAVSVGLHHLTSLTWQFYAVLVGIASYSGCFYTFLAFGNDYLQAKYGMDMDESGKIVGMISFFSAVLSPLAGYVMDKRGGKEYAATVCMLVACIAFTVMGFTDAPIIPSVIAAGLAYSVLPCALYPLIADAVPEEAFTQVYAITNAAVNMVLMVSFYAAGTLSDTTLSEEGIARAAGGEAAKPDYTAVFYLFTTFTGIGTVSTGILAYAHHNKPLEKRGAKYENDGGSGASSRHASDADADAPIVAGAVAPLPGRIVILAAGPAGFATAPNGLPVSGTTKVR